jgi:hypothetical protein
MNARLYLRAAEAAVALLIARVALRVVPFKRLAKLGGTLERDIKTPVPHPATDPIAIRVGCAINGAAMRLPWESSCLVRALAARFMLARRGIASTLILGVTTRHGALESHAWITAAGGALCGGSEAAGYHAIAAFRSDAP